MIIIIRALSPNKKKKGKKGEGQKKKGPKKENKKGQCYYPFFRPCASKYHHDFHDRESLILSLSYTSGNFHYRTWLVYYNDGLPQNSLGLRERASWMHTHLVSFVDLSCIYSSSASVAWQSLLTHIDIY